jgi:hypothetical protein
MCDHLGTFLKIDYFPLNSPIFLSIKYFFENVIFLRIFWQELAHFKNLRIFTKNLFIILQYFL